MTRTGSEHIRAEPKADRRRRLSEAQEMAFSVLASAEAEGLFRPGVSEAELSREIQILGQRLYGRLRHWHKRIVRAGANTLRPYHDDLTNLLIRDPDILFVDMGPVFGEWEADVGRTYVIGEDPAMRAIADAAGLIWSQARDFAVANATRISGADLYAAVVRFADEMGYGFGGPHAGHLIGAFPHERVQGNEVSNYIHADNATRLCDPDAKGHWREWILEVHLVSRTREYGAFVEQWLDLGPVSAQA